MTVNFTGKTFFTGETLILNAVEPPPEPIDFYKDTLTTKVTNPPTTTIIADVPPGVIEDDLMILYHVTSDDVTQSITPAGWTILWQSVQVTNECTTSCYRKFAGAVEPLTVQVNSDSSEQHVVVISTFGGVDMANPINAFNNATNASASTSVVSPTVTTTQGSTMLYVLGATGGFPEPGDLEPDHWVFPGGTIERDEVNTSMDGAQSTLDLSQNAFTVTFFGTAQLDTSSKQSGNASLLEPGTTGNFVSVPGSILWNFGTVDFTLECHANINVNQNSALLGRGAINDSSRWVWFIDTNGNLEFFHSFNQRISSSINISTLGWTHFAISRNSGTTRMYAAGVQIGSTGVTMNITSTGSALEIGKDPEQPNRIINGRIDNVRITTGIGRYPNGTSFSPPSGPLSDDANVQLLIPFDEPILPYGAKAAAGTEFIPFSSVTGTRTMTIDKAQEAQSASIAIARQL